MPGQATQPCSSRQTRRDGVQDSGLGLGLGLPDRLEWVVFDERLAGFIVLSFPEPNIVILGEPFWF